MKRFLSLALALVLVLGMVPATVFAADTTPALPTATVSEITKDDLTFAMNFNANSVTEEQLAYYGNWYADFELTVNKKVTFNNDGSADGWLAGQYDEWSKDWVTVPFGNYAPVTLEANETVKIMAFAAEHMDKPGLKYTFREVYETVKNFDCGVYFDDEFLLANPDLVVTLELKMYNPENESENYVIGETYTYINPVVAKNTATNKAYTTVADALLDCAEGQTVVLIKDTTEAMVSVFDEMTLDLNGHALVTNYVSAFGDIIDSSADNAGLLTVPAKRFLIQEDNAQLPVHNGNGYKFAEIYKFEAAYRKDLGKFGLRPYIEANMLELLKQGSEATGVTVQVKITWKQDHGYRTQNFVYNDQQLLMFLNSYNASTQGYGKLFTLTVNGAEDYEELTFTAMVVSDTDVTVTPESIKEQKPAGNVTTNAQNQVVNDVTIGNGNASALVPSGTQLENGATNVTLSATEMNKTTSNITLSADETMVSMNVHVEGVAANNTTPIIVTLTNLAAEGLNQGNIALYHVENGETVEMTRVYNIDEVDAHNEYYYDIATGTVTMALATFSEVAVVANVENPWGGNIDTNWYNAEKTSFEIYNGDQLAGLSAIVGGMAKDIEQDSFKGKTITLLADIDLADAEDLNEPNKIFYPIGYNCDDGSYEKTGDKAVSTGFYSFCGTFDGNGHTIANFYQNTWEMKGDHNWYAPEDQHYRDGMGLFGKVYGGTVKNLTIANFSSDGEIATTGCVAAYADCGATFENIAIKYCNPRVYNIGNGGIVGCVGWYTKDVTRTPVTFKNITVDNTNKISALWGSWDVSCGGIVGQYYPTSGQSSANYPVNAGITFENCHVAAQIDVYNDVCANYQYYAYRYAGILMGSVRENVTIDGHEYPKMDGITAKDCSVHFGDWNDYYYCELVANSLASYTHDHQMSRLTQVTFVDVENMKYVDLKGVEYDIPTSGRVNYVVVLDKNDDGSWKHGDGHEYAKCYHFVDGVQHFHDEADADNSEIYETVDGVEVLKEDKQCIYREFNNLVTGDGWGVTSKGIDDMNGVEILDGKGSIDKFKPLVGHGTTFESGTSVTITRLFNSIDLAESEQLLNIKSESVQVFVSPVDEKSDARGTYVANTKNWRHGHVTFSGVGVVNITISDYFYCNPFTITVEITEPNLIKNGSFGGVDIFNYWNLYSGLNPFADISENAHSGKYAGTFTRSNAGQAGIKQIIELKDALPSLVVDDKEATNHNTLKEATKFTVSAWTHSEIYKNRRINLIAVLAGGTILPEGTKIYEDNKLVTLSAPKTYEKMTQVTLAIDTGTNSEGWREQTIEAIVPAGTLRLVVNIYIPYFNEAPAEPEVICVDDVFCGIKYEDGTLGANLFKDPDFETVVLKTEGWTQMTNATIELQQDDQRNGILKLTDESDKTGAIATYHVDVQANAKYTLSLRCKAEMTNEYCPSVHIREYINGVEAGKDTVYMLEQKGGWVYYTTTVTTSADCTALDIFPYFSQTAQGTAYFDDFSLTLVRGTQE